MTPFLQALREGYPGAHIAMVTGEAYASLLAGWPWVDEWIVQEKRRQANQPWRYVAWVSALRRGEWDLVFDLTNPGTFSYSQLILSFVSGAPVRVGFTEPRKQGTLAVAVPSPAPECPFALAPLALLRALDLPITAMPLSCPLSEPESAGAREWRRDRLDRSYAVVHVGGRGAKAWPMTAWCDFLSRAREGFSGRLVLVAGPGERDRMRELSGDTIPGVVEAPAMSVSDLGHLIEGAEAYVGCDTGVMHLATAVGTPTVALFFDSDPYHYAPLGDENACVLLANPYGVRDDVWSIPVESISRARLLRSESDPTQSQAGIPATDAAALDTVVRAFALVTAGSRPIQVVSEEG